MLHYPLPSLLKVADFLIARNEKMATAESCTGGLIAKLVTDIAGSSRWFEGGFVTYSNKSKSSLLSIDKEIIKEYGAVSSQVAEAMARGAAERLNVSLALSTTGNVGPSCGDLTKSVGCIYIGLYYHGCTHSHLLHLRGSRMDQREQIANIIFASTWRYLIKNQYK